MVQFFLALAISSKGYQEGQVAPGHQHSTHKLILDKDKNLKGPAQFGWLRVHPRGSDLQLMEL